MHGCTRAHVCTNIFKDTCMCTQTLMHLYTHTHTIIYNSVLCISSSLRSIPYKYKHHARSLANHHPYMGNICYYCYSVNEPLNWNNLCNYILSSLASQYSFKWVACTKGLREEALKPPSNHTHACLPHKLGDKSIRHSYNLQWPPVKVFQTTCQSFYYSTYTLLKRTSCPELPW